MKNMKTIKLISAIMGIALLLGAALALAVSAEGESAKSPEIISYNVEYGEKYSLMYAVDASTVNESPVTLNLYAKDPATGAESIRSYTAAESTTIKIDGVDTEAYVFITDGVAAKNLTQIFYAQATDNTKAAGNVVRYSVIEYMYQRLSGQQTITANQASLYRNVIELASDATQVLINDKTESTEDDVTLAIDYSYVFFSANDGVIIETAEGTDGYKKGIYPIGTTVYPKVAETATGNITVTVYDDNASVKLQKVIKNGAAYQLDGDMTVITAGGEMPYSPDLTDTEGRLTFDNGETPSNYKYTYTGGTFTSNSSTTIYGVADANPWGVASKVFKVNMIGSQTTYWTWANPGTAPADATGLRYEVDMMFEVPSANVQYSLNFCTGKGTWANTPRIYVDLNTNGTIKITDRNTSTAYTNVAEAGQWFRLTVELDHATNVATYFINGEEICKCTRSDVSSLTDISAIQGAWFQSGSSASGAYYMDNIKVEFIK